MEKRRKNLQQQLRTAEREQRQLQGQVGIKKDNKRKLQIANINQYQDEPKRQTAEHLQRKNIISAQEEHKNHDIENDEENKHESEQEGSNSDDGNALESQQDEQNSVVSTRTNSVRRQVKDTLKKL